MENANVTETIKTEPTAAVPPTKPKETGLKSVKPKEESNGPPCLGCGRSLKIKARGLCSTCYKSVVAGEAAPLPGEGVITVDFAACPDVLRELQRRADDEMRPLGNQVVWELRRALN